MVFISGPVSMYYLKNKNQRVYLFGDEHYTTNGICESKSIDMISFFDKIFTSDLYKDKIDTKIIFKVLNTYTKLLRNKYVNNYLTNT